MISVYILKATSATGMRTAHFRFVTSIILAPKRITASTSITTIIRFSLSTHCSLCIPLRRMRNPRKEITDSATIKARKTFLSVPDVMKKPINKHPKVKAKQLNNTEPGHPKIKLTVYPRYRNQSHEEKVTPHPMMALLYDLLIKSSAPATR